MRRCAIIATLSALAACNLPEIPTDLTPTEPTQTDGSETLITADDEGSIVVMQTLPWVRDRDPSTQSSAIFVETDRGVANLAQCLAARNTYCTDSLPQAPGDIVETYPFDEELLPRLFSRDVGERIELGPFGLRRVEDSSLQPPLTYYFRFDAGASPASGDLELRMDGGEWGAFKEVVAPAPAPFELLDVNPLVEQEFEDAVPFPLRWTPGGPGDIYLHVEVPEGSYLTRIEDTGAYDLDFNQFSLEQGDPVTLMIGRWSVEDVDVRGHELNVQVQINQWLSGTFRRTGSRVELVPFDTCEDALGAPPVPPGEYVGSLGSYANDYSPVVGEEDCTGWTAVGNDGVIPITLQPRERVEVTYDFGGVNDASIYLTEVCGATDTCLEGADDRLFDPETFTYVNESGAVQDLWLVLDAREELLGGNFELTIDLTPVFDDPLVSSCVDALQQGPVATGVYSGSLGGAPDLLDPVSNPYLPPDSPCQAGSPTPGGDGKAEIFLEPNQKLTVDVELPSGDPVLYLLYNCSLSNSCFAWADNRRNRTETLTYTNTTGFAEYVYIVLDGAQSPDDYFLEVTIQ